MKKALFLSICALTAGLAYAVDRGQPPVNDAVILTRVTLSRLELLAPVTHTPGLLPEKKEHLPLSVQLYLKPSGQLDSTHASLQKAAQKVRKQVAPGAKQKALLRDSVAVSQEVWVYLEEALPVDANLDLSGQPRTDWRLSWPKASEILSAGKTDADGRALVEVALLRALKVPARTAWAKGRLATQYWVAMAPEAVARGASKPKASKGKSKKKAKNAPKTALGYWALLDPSLHDEDIEAWSLDNGALKRLHWAPEQELSVQRLGWHREVYAASESQTARARLDALASNGRWIAQSTSPTASALSPSAALDLSGAGTWYVLTQESFRLETEGSLAPAESIDLLSPYRPQQPQGREAAPRVSALELEAQALWSDRPERLRLRSGNKPRDEWQSPPPAVGMLHYLSFGLRRPATVLQAKRSATMVSGVCLRADNLSPRAGWELQLAAQGVSTPSQVLKLPEDGHFNLTLTAQEQALPLLELRSGTHADGDLQLLAQP